MKSIYDIHPSRELRDLFAAMPIPYQGQDLNKAKAIFVGLDANYAEKLFEFPNFKERILEYHRDGPEFWKRYGVHHPFLLDEYPYEAGKDGVRYHKQFRKMALGTEFADYVSFTELLNVPTVGRTDPKVFWSLFDPDHCRALDSLLCNRNGSRVVLLSKGVVRFMLQAQKRYGLFHWLPREVNWGPIGKIGQTGFYVVKHFSASISDKEIGDIGRLVRSYCEVD